MTILIQLVALPLVIGLFGSSSLWSLFANIVIVPLMPFLAGFSLLAGLLPGAMGAVVAFPARILLKGVAAFLTLLTEFPLPIRMGGLGLALTAVASLGLLLHLSGLGFKKTAYLLVTGMSIVVLVFNFFTHCVTTVWFLDVGQGMPLSSAPGGSGHGGLRRRPGRGEGSAARSAVFGSRQA